ncbi:putative ribonuclease H superfamily [Plasmopara halstedii]
MERVTQIMEDLLRSYTTSFKEWSELLTLAEFVLNNSAHVSTSHSPIYVNYGNHPIVRAPIMCEVSTLSGEGIMALQPHFGLNDVTELKAKSDCMRPLGIMTSREEQHLLRDKPLCSLFETQLRKSSICKKNKQTRAEGRTRRHMRSMILFYLARQIYPNMQCSTWKAKSF